jgi:6-phosphogluconate dehydrogenase
MIGAGSIGGGIALLLTENGLKVSIQDPSSQTVDAVIMSAEAQGIHNKLSKYPDKVNASLCSSLGSPKIIFFSLPHGTVGDSVVEGLHAYREKGNVIIDCSNEMWENTQRRQGKFSCAGNILCWVWSQWWISGCEEGPEYVPWRTGESSRYCVAVT